MIHRGLPRVPAPKPMKKEVKKKRVAGFQFDAIHKQARKGPQSLFRADHQT